MSVDFQKGLTAYESGDYATALREFEPLAIQGIAHAQFYLGVMYAQGRGVPQNDETAMKWFRLSAGQGDARAQTGLGAIYAIALKDYVYAHMWGNLAAMNGDKSGAKLFDEIKEKMTPADISAAQKLTRECIRKKYKGC